MQQRESLFRRAGVSPFRTAGLPHQTSADRSGPEKHCQKQEAACGRFVSCAAPFKSGRPYRSTCSFRTASFSRLPQPNSTLMVSRTYDDLIPWVTDHIRCGPLRYSQGQSCSRPEHRWSDKPAAYSVPTKSTHYVFRRSSNNVLHLGQNSRCRTGPHGLSRVHGRKGSWELHLNSRGQREAVSDQSENSFFVSRPRPKISGTARVAKSLGFLQSYGLLGSCVHLLWPILCR